MAKTSPGGSVAAALAALRKNGAEVGSYSDFDNFKVTGLPTGNLTIDNMTGIGGFPSGRITELVGPPSSGKTTAALQCAARVQQNGGVVFFNDFEKALDPDYAVALGLDVHDNDTFIYMRPDSFEDGANAFREFQKLSDGAVDLVIHDSVAAMTTRHELEAETGAVQVADRAKMMYQYCLTPDHKVLREDLRWVPLGDCQIGDVVLGFDEDLPEGSGGRKYRRAVVKSVQRQVSEDMYRVTLSSGKQFRVTGNHKWLTGRSVGKGYTYDWRETAELREGLDFSPRILDMWEEDHSKDAGWLAGMFDGEGHLNLRTENRVSGLFVGVGQKVGAEADRIERLLKEFCASAPLVSDTDETSENLAFRRFGVAGPLREKLKFLGTVRPERLIAKVDFDTLGRLQSWNRDPEAVVRVEKIEAQEIVIMETSTGTFIADGYPMHNCRQLLPILTHTNCAAIFLNHLLEMVDTTPMGRQMAARGIKRKTSPGGNAIPYYASLRMEFKQIGNLKNSEMDALTNEKVDVVRQTKTQATVIKNKVGDPFRTAELRVRFGKGFSQEYSVFSILVAHNVIKKTGAWFEFKDPALRLDDDHVKVNGENTVLARMEENPEWFAILRAKAEEIIDTNKEATFEVGDLSGWENPEGAE